MPNGVAGSATGVPARATLRPESAAQVVDAVRESAVGGTPLRIAGAGTWLDAGRPVNSDTRLDLSALHGIIEYVPGDLVLTARAGTSLAEIDAATREHSQWLPLVPFGSPTGTLGATLATASSGPLGASYGLPRDAALGVSFVTGDGRLVHGGGRVVKNVAGFDLVRLTIGAWGTLGVIVEASVRLRARPEIEESVLLPLPDEPAGVAALLSAIRSAAVAPLAAEMVNDRLASRIGLDAANTLLVRLAGNAEGVHAQRSELARIAEPRPVPMSTWERLRDAEPAACAVVRLSRRPSEMPDVWRAACELASRLGGDAHATIERGIARCWLPAIDADAVAQALAVVDSGIARVFERLPRAWWARVAPAPAIHPLARSVREAFDPKRILNPGILTEAIA